VLALAITSFAVTILFLLIVTFVAHKLLYPRVPWIEVAKFPVLIVVAQLLAYVAVFTLMYVLVMHGHSESFWKAIRWNFPVNWPVYILGGVVLSIGLQLFAHLLPIPKNLPMDQFFQTTGQAYLLAIFGVTFAPFLEELFFRGFLYPVLARRLGVALAIFLTAVGFALIHGAQLTYAWGPVLVIFIVGLTFTAVRAVTKSVAAGFLMHVAYNGTISLIMFAATGGFRHLERLNQ
jgi:uncharacterized protein